MIELIKLSLVVFAITLTITKAEIFASTREFVKYRYEASFVGDGRPGWFHRWFYKMWTCPMCLGFWVSLFLCLLIDIKYSFWISVLSIYGLNWLWHCIEDFLFFGGSFFKKNVESKH